MLYSVLFSAPEPVICCTFIFCSLCTVPGDVHCSLGHHHTTPYYLPGSYPFELPFSTSLLRFMQISVFRDLFHQISKAACLPRKYTKAREAQHHNQCAFLRDLYICSDVYGLSIFPTDGVASHDMDLVKLGLQKQNFPCDPVGLYELESFFQRWFFDSCDPIKMRTCVHCLGSPSANSTLLLSWGWHFDIWRTHWWLTKGNWQQSLWPHRS